MVERNEETEVEEEDVRERELTCVQGNGGAAMNAIIKTEVAVNKVGIIQTPHHPQ
jgi:hypothetical protein